MAKAPDYVRWFQAAVNGLIHAVNNLPGNSDSAKPVSAVDDQVPPGTQAFFFFLVWELRDREMMQVVRTFLESVPGLRGALPSLEGTELSEPLKNILKTYDYLSVLKKVESGSRLLGEYIVTRGVDNFQCYLAEVLAAMFRARPETLRSSDKVNVEDVLMCASMDEFVSRIAERKTEQLTYNACRR